MSSTDCVKSEISSGLSAKAIMKNSSCGFAVLKNSLTASRDFSILLLILPLTSEFTAEFDPPGTTGIAVTGGTAVSVTLGWAGGRMCGSSRGLCAHAAGIRAHPKQTPSVRLLSSADLRGDNIRSSNGQAFSLAA